jgi:hypothetical protein
MWPGPAFGKPEALFVTWHNIAITLIDRVVIVVCRSCGELGFIQREIVLAARGTHPTGIAKSGPFPESTQHISLLRNEPVPFNMMC